MPDIIERIATLEANYARDAIEAAERAAFRNTVLTTLATIEANQKHFLDYQQKCDAERLIHSTRIAKMENRFAFYAGASTVLGTIGGFIASLFTRHI